MLHWVIRAHPYLASFALLVVWCAIGFLQARFISRAFASVTWSIAILASAVAVAEQSDLGPLRWGLAIAIVLGGTARIVYYYNLHIRDGRVRN